MSGTKNSQNFDGTVYPFGVKYLRRYMRMFNMAFHTMIINSLVVKRVF